MATKKEQLDAKLGSWTDQASLTRSHAAPPTEDAAQTAVLGTAAQEKVTPTPDSPPVRSVYASERGLLDRIDEFAATRGLTPNEAIGRLLTWALDQADKGSFLVADRDSNPSG